MQKGQWSFTSFAVKHLAMSVQVRRSPYLVNDTLLQIQNASAQNTLKRPLKVQFIGEQGVDEGGVQKVQFFFFSFLFFLFFSTVWQFWST